MSIFQETPCLSGDLLGLLATGVLERNRDRVVYMFRQMSRVRTRQILRQKMPETETSSAALPYLASNLVQLREKRMHLLLPLIGILNFSSVCRH